MVRITDHMSELEREIIRSRLFIKLNQEFAEKNGLQFKRPPFYPRLYQFSRKAQRSCSFASYSHSSSETNPEMYNPWAGIRLYIVTKEGVPLIPLFSNLGVKIETAMNELNEEYKSTFHTNILGKEKCNVPRVSFEIVVDFTRQPRYLD